MQIRIAGAVLLLLLVSTSSGLMGRKPFIRPQLAQAQPVAQAPLNGSASKNFPNEYVVVLKDGLIENEVTAHVGSVAKTLQRGAEEIIETFFVDNSRIKDGVSFKGYAAKLSDKTRDALRANKDVEYIEYNGEYTLSACTVQNGATWGIERTTKVNLPLNTQYRYNAPTAGAGIDAYIIDTGIDVTHPNFGGRAIWGMDLVYTFGQPDYQRDRNGHGTHVAGTVMSTLHGVAKQATAVAVKIFDTAGRTSTIRIIRGIMYASNRISAQGRRGVINMSLNGPKSNAENQAVNAAVDKGTVVVVSAGNYGTDGDSFWHDACNNSPASATKAVVVASSNNLDQFAFDSCRGRCVTIIAPGVGITSTIPGGLYGQNSGTSMAAPHVTGVVAKYLSVPANSNKTPAEVKSWLVTNAGTDKITNIPIVPTNTPNKLLYYLDCTP